MGRDGMGRARMGGGRIPFAELRGCDREYDWLRPPPARCTARRELAWRGFDGVARFGSASKRQMLSHAAHSTTGCGQHRRYRRNLGNIDDTDNTSGTDTTNNIDIILTTPMIPTILMTPTIPMAPMIPTTPTYRRQRNHRQYRQEDGPRSLQVSSILGDEWSTQQATTSAYSVEIAVNRYIRLSAYERES